MLATAHDHLGYLAGDDRLRAADFVAAWTDPDTAAVWAARGGYGAQRMVDLLDFDLLRAAGPKHLVGFSDITALHSRLGRELGQVTVHGPVAGSVEQLSDEPTGRSLRQLIMDRAGARVPCWSAGCGVRARDGVRAALGRQPQSAGQ